MKKKAEIMQKLNEEEMLIYTGGGGNNLRRYTSMKACLPVCNTLKEEKAALASMKKKALS